MWERERERERKERLISMRRFLYCSTVPLLPSKGVLAALFGFVFIFGIAIGQRIGRSSMIKVPFNNAIDLGRKGGSSEAKAPTGISVLLEGDLKKKEFVEW